MYTCCRTARQTRCQVARSSTRCEVHCPLSRINTFHRSRLEALSRERTLSRARYRCSVLVSVRGKFRIAKAGTAKWSLGKKRHSGKSVMHCAYSAASCVRHFKRCEGQSQVAFFGCCGCVLVVKDNPSRERTSRTGESLRATPPTANGHSFGEILTAGEWKSSSFLKYCQAVTLRCRHC